MIDNPHYDLHISTYGGEPGDPLHGYETIVVDAGIARDEVVAEGTKWERTIQRWPHRIEVTVSPKGRSVQVHVDGKRVLP